MCEIFFYFSNTDEEMPPTIIYQDLIHMLRLCNLLDIEDLEESHINIEEARDLYKKHSSHPWKNHVYALDL